MFDQSTATLITVENPLADIDRIEAITDPEQRAIEIGRVLNELPEVAAKLRAWRQADVVRMREQGMSLAEIGIKLGLHRNRVQQIAEGRTT